MQILFGLGVEKDVKSTEGMCYRIQFKGDTETDAVTSDSLRGIEARLKQRNERGLERECNPY